MTSVALNYVIDGPAGAPPLVLLGSIGSTLAMWEKVLPDLARDFRVIRVDHRGHGPSPGPAGPYTMGDLGGDVLTLLDRLALPTASFCGLSLGGMVGMWLAAESPSRIDRLALLSTSAKLGTPAIWAERAALVRAQGMSPVAELAVGRWLTPALAARDPSLVAQLVDMVRATSAEAYASCCEAIGGWDGTRMLASIVAPTLVVTGQDDPATTPAHAYAIGAALAGARVRVLERAAHVPALERPGALARLLVDHFRGGVTEASAPGDTDAERAERGQAIRREVLGDAYVDRSGTQTSPFSAAFQDLVKGYAWGDIWARPGLSRAERSIITLAVLGALGHEHELSIHAVAAWRNGLTPDQIGEILLHLAIYAGVPAANRAFAVAQRALSEAGAI